MTRFDLHIHTALSACSENILSPRQILTRARGTGLNLIALTDHNASAHVALTCRLADQYGLTVVPAMEVTSREEVHVLVYFPGLEELQQFQRLVDENLPAMANDPEFFGWQLVYDENDQIIGVDERLRQVGTGLTLETLNRVVHNLNGWTVPAHVFRPRYSLKSQLGFIDTESRFDAVEVTGKEWRERGLQLGDRVESFIAVAGSDSHFLEDIGRFSLTSEKTVTRASELDRLLR